MARRQASRAEITGRLVARHGCARVSVRRIAAEVGVRAGALYAFTPDRQALPADPLREQMTARLQAWRDDPARPALARLQGFRRFHIRTSLVRPEAVLLAHMERRSLTPANRAAMRMRAGGDPDRRSGRGR